MDEAMKFRFNPHSELDRGRQAYEHYKLVWMLSHGFTLRDLYTEISNAMVEYSEDLDEAIENFEMNIGFGSGSLWPCYDEFMGCEYHECGYDKEDS